MLKSALAAAAAAATEQANTSCQLGRLAFCTFTRFITFPADIDDEPAVLLQKQNRYL